MKLQILHRACNIFGNVVLVYLAPHGWLGQDYLEMRAFGDIDKRCQETVFSLVSAVNTIPGPTGVELKK